MEYQGAFLFCFVLFPFSVNKNMYPEVSWAECLGG